MMASLKPSCGSLEQVKMSPTKFNNDYNDSGDDDNMNDDSNVN
jgi:hypothetical protein